MKKLNFLFILLIVSFFSFNGNAADRQNILKIYNWADYIDVENVLNTFPAWYKAQTGEDVEIIYQTFEINETMLTEIEIGHEDYDLICPSEYIIGRMLKNNLLLPIEKSLVPDSINYFKNISSFAAEKFELMAPNSSTKVSDYAVGYMWGTTGFLYNPQYVSAEDVQSWSILIDPRFENQIYVKDAFRDVYSVVVQYVYKDEIASGAVNRDTLVAVITPEAIARVEEFLMAMRPNVKGWEVDNGKEEMTKGRLWIDLLWSGDAQWAIEEAQKNGLELRYDIPQEGSTVWFDGWCIPKYAKNTKAATYFINYLCREDNAIYNMEEIGYVSVIATDAIREWATDSTRTELLDLTYFFGSEAKNVPANPVFYPDAKTISRCALMTDCAEHTQAMLEMWSRIKGNNLNPFMLVTLGIVLCIIIFFIAIQIARKKDISKMVKEKM